MTNFIEITGHGKEVVAVLVKGDGHHAVGGVECLLNAVPVVDVDINVEHARVESTLGGGVAGVVELLVECDGIEY